MFNNNKRQSRNTHYEYFCFEIVVEHNFFVCYTLLWVFLLCLLLCSTTISKFVILYYEYFCFVFYCCWTQFLCLLYSLWVFLLCLLLCWTTIKDKVWNTHIKSISKKLCFTTIKDKAEILCYKQRNCVQQQ